MAYTDNNSSSRAILECVHAQSDTALFKVSLSQTDIPGGGLACCAIALVASFSMSKRGTPKEVVSDIDWHWIIRTGVRVYDKWDEHQRKEWGGDEGVGWRGAPRPERGPLPFMNTIEDFKRVPLMAEVFECMRDEREFGGSMDSSFNEDANARAGVGNGMMDAVHANLEHVTRYMGEIARAPGGSRSGCVCSVGDRSFALWTNGQGTFVLYDSHPDPSGPYAGRSTVYVSDEPAMNAFIRLRFQTVTHHDHSRSKNSHHKNEGVFETFIGTSPYSAYVFRIDSRKASIKNVRYT
jgi:hypothetical protein